MQVLAPEINVDISPDATNKNINVIDIDTINMNCTIRLVRSQYVTD